MIAVSNTTPLRYLIAIEQEDLFPGVFEKVFVPSEVHEELTNARTPERVREFVRSSPPWYEVREVRNAPAIPFPAILHRAEQEAILLAEALKPDFVLIDEQVGRSVARELISQCPERSECWSVRIRWGSSKIFQYSWLD